VGSGLIRLILIFQQVLVVAMLCRSQKFLLFFIINQGKQACLGDAKSTIAHALSQRSRPAIPTWSLVSYDDI
jgi:hypothetical protein